MSTWDRLWLAEDDRKLLALRAEGVAWDAIYQRFPGRTPKAVMQRHQRLTRGEAKESGRLPWTTTEQSDEVMRLRDVEHRQFPEIDRIMGRKKGSSAQHYRDLVSQRNRAAGKVAAPKAALRARPQLPDPASITAWLCGDPLPGRSALDEARNAVAAPVARSRITLPTKPMELRP